MQMLDIRAIALLITIMKLLGRATRVVEEALLPKSPAVWTRSKNLRSIAKSAESEWMTSRKSAVKERRTMKPWA